MDFSPSRSMYRSENKRMNTANAIMDVTNLFKSSTNVYEVQKQLGEFEIRFRNVVSGKRKLRHELKQIERRSELFEGGVGEVQENLQNLFKKTSQCEQILHENASQFQKNAHCVEENYRKFRTFERKLKNQDNGIREVDQNTLNAEKLLREGSNSLKLLQNDSGFDQDAQNLRVLCKETSSIIRQLGLSDDPIDRHSHPATKYGKTGSFRQLLCPVENCGRVFESERNLQKHVLGHVPMQRNVDVESSSGSSSTGASEEEEIDFEVEKHNIEMKLKRREEYLLSRLMPSVRQESSEDEIEEGVEEEREVESMEDSFGLVVEEHDDDWREKMELLEKREVELPSYEEVPQSVPATVVNPFFSDEDEGEEEEIDLEVIGDVSDDSSEEEGVEIETRGLQSNIQGMYFEKSIEEEEKELSDLMEQFQKESDSLKNRFLESSKKIQSLEQIKFDDDGLNEDIFKKFS